MELLLLEPLTVQPAGESHYLKIQGEVTMTLTLSNAYDGAAAVMSVHWRISCGDYKI